MLIFKARFQTNATFSYLLRDNATLSS